ncbi:uncharacterized protein LOC124447329 isoform X2 [Xenia sp. Carnegie-2017]|uniref:uncharacterized protein LOC124447329 isoform X2 n=1 Tax=Xenia sp. Carnegie-2017 TaxID=2897299 RepID=UPI001F03D00C|nr:uncharacterized protein LOC124447329 isoform X2 [Xenia sp. Carnegie-2017]
MMKMKRSHIVLSLSLTVKNETAFVDSVAIEITFNNKTALPHDSIKLECDVEPKSAVESVVWYKEGKIVHNSRRMTLDKNLLAINETLQSDTGYYTCSVYSTSGNHNMTAFLTILESEQEDDNEPLGSGTSKEPNRCGAPKTNLYSDCGQAVFPNCQSFAPPVDKNTIKINMSLSSLSFDPILVKIHVQWEIPRAGNSDIWGWQMTVTDIGRYPGIYKCQQINKKYSKSMNGAYYVDYVITDVALDTLKLLRIQSLPAMADSTAAEKTITTAARCHIIPDLPCCYQAKNIVVKQLNSTSVSLTWNDMNKTTLHLGKLKSFFLNYNSSSCHESTIVVNAQTAMNNSQIIINDLKHHCRRYTIQVTPIFSDDWCALCKSTCHADFNKGIPSTRKTFEMISNAKVNYHVKNATMNNLYKPVIIVTVVLIATILLVLVAIFRKKKKDKKKMIIKSMTIPERKLVTKVFIIHGSHCEGCEDVAIALATYLNLTGYCECSLDLCAHPNDWSQGTMQYYENSIAVCSKVIVLFTVNKNLQWDDGVKARNLIYQENLIRSEIKSNNKTKKFIPVYVDPLSDGDLPLFIQNKKSFSLPSQLADLIFFIIEEPMCKPLPNCSKQSLQEDMNLVTQRKLFEVQIKNLNAKHHKKLKSINNNALTAEIALL